MAPNLVGQRWKQARTTKTISGIDKLVSLDRGLYAMNRDGNFYAAMYTKSTDEADWNLILSSGVTDVVSMTQDHKWVVGKRGGVWLLDVQKKELLPQVKVTNADLNAVSYYSGGTSSKGMIAVGERGTIIGQIPGGESIRVFSENRFPELFDVSEIDYRTVWAIGDSGSIVVSGDKGSTWNETVRRPKYRFKRIIVFDVATILLAGTDLTTNTALLIRTNIHQNVWEEHRFEGSSEITDGKASSRLQTAYIAGDRGLFARTTDNAATWELCGGGAKISFTGVCYTDHIISAVGRSQADGSYRNVASRDSGRTWEVRFDSGDSLGAIVAPYSRYPGLCALGNGAVINHYDFGNTTLAKPVAWLPFVPRCAVGLRDRRFFVGGADGYLARITEYGPPPVISKPITDDFIAIDGNGGDTLIAVASGGMYRSVDTGSTWTRMHTLGADQRLTRCRFVNRTVCVATGIQSGVGVVQKSTDAGASWTTLLRHPVEVTGFTIDEQGALVVCTADGKVMVTADDGASWNTLLTLEGRCFRDISASGYASELFLLQDGETVLRSSEGGKNWGVYRFPGEDFLHIAASNRRFRAWGNAMSAVNFYIDECSYPFRLSDPDVKTIASREGSTKAYAIGADGNILRIWYYGLRIENDLYPAWNATRYREELRDVCLIGDRIGIVVGDSGIILRSNYPETEWEMVHRDPGIGALSQVLPLSSGGALAAGDEVLLRSDSTGTHWTKLDGYRGQHLALFDDRTWVACTKAGNLYLTEDAGRNWGMTGVIPGTPREMVVSGDSKIFVLIRDTTRGRERYTVTRSLDFGATWHTLIETEDQIRRMRIFDGSRIFLLGTKGRVNIGDDYGRSWTETRSPLFKDFNDVAELYPYRYLFTGENRVLDILDMPAPVTTEAVTLQAPSSAEIKAVFPNPARDFVLVSLEAQTVGSVELSLYNSLGKAVWKKRDDVSPGTGNTQRIDIGQLPPGVYYLRLTGTETMDFRKLLIYR